MSNVGRMFTYQNSNWVTIFLTEKNNMFCWCNRKINYKDSDYVLIEAYLNISYTEVK